jgi:aldehyde dehydrogenase (NAD+)
MIKAALKTLGISSQNLGSSTGQQWFSEGKEFESFSLSMENSSQT